ncbi:tumor necrosis factor receptor superfamily member 10B-like [Cynocephalus volans]|uniref:tumor necrosis factor receptor superfamily member 10B-like n=1 Tax=Cynocephalus volans TaxID=110931 RepID=UPI002FCBFA42
MGQRGRSTLDASGSQAGSAPGPRWSRRARSQLRVPKTLMFLVAGVLLSVSADSTAITQHDGVHQLTVAPRLCPPGSHLSEESGDCLSCTYGVDYTAYSNTLPLCVLCTVCKSDEEEKSPCTTTRNTVCQCKPGTFRGKDSPEMCQKCSTRCPNWMVKKSPCTSSRDLECVPKESGNKNRFNKITVLLPSLLFVAFVVWKILPRKKILPYLKNICAGCYGCVSKWMNRVSGFLQDLRELGAQELLPACSRTGWIHPRLVLVHCPGSLKWPGGSGWTVRGKWPF